MKSLLMNSKNGGDNQVEFGSVKVEVNLDLLVDFFEKKKERSNPL